MGSSTAFADDTEGLATESLVGEPLTEEQFAKQLEAALDDLQRASGRSVWEAARE
ncbi:hypothetical protein [Streptomyces sp. NPDC019890]|uniref:hypothetical protein n=1 Tax=Streptomyces sp. NPDC019890 TaxID=3365064 RepID=UPI0038515EEE